VVILLAACGNSDDAAPNNTQIRSQTPFPTPMTTSPASPENAIHFNTFSHISGAITITYPSNWLIETDGNEVNGSVNIGNTRSAQIGNPTPLHRKAMFVSLSSSAYLLCIRALFKYFN
jgi:hypothetical protein